MPDRIQRLRRFILVVLFADLMVVGARISLPVPPVPLTMQTAVALLSGALLGPRGGAASQALYLAMGLAGLPVFAGGGGISYALSPTFGYLLGFAGGAWLTGFLMEGKREGGLRRAHLAMLAGLAVIYAIGVPFLWFNLRFVQGKIVAPSTVIGPGLLLPLPGDLLKIAVAAPVAARLSLWEGFAPAGRRK